MTSAAKRATLGWLDRSADALRNRRAHALLARNMLRRALATMRYFALATDYDGTLATGGVVDDATLCALERFVASGRKLLLVTGRQLGELEEVFPRLDLFECVVAENGAVLYTPSSRAVRALAQPPNPAWIAALRARGVEPLSVGHVIVATREPHEAAVLDVIRSMGMELHVEFNKGSVMVLPAGVTKGTGLAAALLELGLSEHNVVGVGDAENDHALLGLCECAVSVANALPSLKERSDWVTPATHGAGVTQLIDRVLGDDLCTSAPARHRLLLGQAGDGEPVTVEPYGRSVLVTRPAGGEDSVTAMALLERLIEKGYQVCVIDPEGDHEERPAALVVGTPEHAPTADEVVRALADPRRSVTATLVAVPPEDRASWMAALLARVLDLRVHTGRPHWVVIDQADRVLPTGWEPTQFALPNRMSEILLLTVRPERVSRALLAEVDVVLATGPRADESLRAFAEATGRPMPEHADPAEASLVLQKDDAGVERVIAVEATAVRRNQLRASASK